MPKLFHIEMPFALYDIAMLDAHCLSAVVDLLVIIALFHDNDDVGCCCRIHFTSK